MDEDRLDLSVRGLRELGEYGCDWVLDVVGNVCGSP